MVTIIRCKESYFSYKTVISTKMMKGSVSLVTERNIKSRLSGFFRKHKAKKLVALSCAAAIVAGAFPVLTLSASAQTTLEARTTDYLNLRSGAGVNYSVVRLIGKNEKVTVLDRSDSSWIKVRLQNGKVGYCSNNFLDVINDGQTTTYVNFRKGAGTYSEVIRTLPPKTKIDIINFAGSSWAKAKTSDGTVGYICTDYIEYISSNNTQAAAPAQVSSANSTVTGSQTSKPAQTNNSVQSVIKLSASSRTMTTGSSVTLKATDNQGTVSWSTSNGRVATISSKGLVTAVGEGNANITAIDTKNGKNAVCKVKVIKTDYTSIRLSDTSKTLSEGENFTLQAVSNPAGGKIYFRTSDTSVAKVSAKGVVSAVGAGTADVTAYDSTGYITALCKVTVNSRAKISLSDSSLSISAGGSARLYASATPSNLKLRWSSSNVNVAAVNDGMVSGISAGTAVISVTDVSGKVRQSCTVTVRGVSSSNVRLSRYSATTTAGKTIYIKGYNGSRWESSDRGLATVRDGFIETCQPGNVAISFVDSYGNRAICNVKIIEAAPIKFAYSSPNSATINQKVELIAITDQFRTGVYFDVNQNGQTVRVKANSKTSDGKTYVWKAYYTTVAAGDFTVRAYSLRNSVWSTCSDGTTDVYVTNKTDYARTGLDKLRASDGVIKYIGLKEGFVSDITYDRLANNIPTLGHGYVVWEGQCFYDHLTRNEAYALLVKAVNEEVYSKRVNEFLIGNNCRFNQQQFDALVSFSYNLGTGWTYSSDLRNILLNSYGTVSSGTSMKGVVTSTSGLHLRSEPTTSAKSLGILPYNSTVTLVSTQKYNNVWYKVKTSSGQVGYCSGSYLNVNASSGTVGRDLNYVNRNALIREMLAYHHAGGVCYYGLLYRRADELEMFLYNDYVADGRDNNHYFPNPSCISFP